MLWLVSNCRGLTVVAAAHNHAWIRMPAGLDIERHAVPDLDAYSVILAALYLRLAESFERSASLADDHAERLHRKGQEQLAAREFDRAEWAREAARRARELAASACSARRTQ